MEPERTTNRNRALEALVAVLQREGMDVALERAYNRYAVVNRKGNRILSPRGTNSEVSEWLRAYAEGWRARGHREVSNAGEGN